MSVIMFAIQSTGQTVYKQVPDSLTCITPSQDVFNIEQAFIIKELGTSNILKDKTIGLMNQESGFLREEIAKKDAVIDLHLLQLQHSQSDVKYLKEELHKANRGKRLFKIGFVICAGVAVVELGVIGVMRLVRWRNR